MAKFILSILTGVMLLTTGTSLKALDFDVFINNQRDYFIKNIQQHEHSSIPNPCGGTGQEMMTDSITKYFMFRWQAQFQELRPDHLKIYKQHFSLSEEVVSVRIFTSPKQPTLAALASRLFENYLDEEKTKPLVSLLCIVPASNKILVRQHSKQELHDILRTKDKNI